MLVLVPGELVVDRHADHRTWGRLRLRRGLAPLKLAESDAKSKGSEREERATCRRIPHHTGIRTAVVCTRES